MLFSERDKRVLRLLTDREQLAFKRILICTIITTPNDELTDDGHLLNHGLAKPGRIGWHIAPANHVLAFLDAEIFEVVDAKVAGPVILRQEAHGDGIIAGLRQGDARACRPFAEQGVWNLDQNARAIAQERISAHGTAMVNIHKDLEAAFNGFVRFHAFNIGHKADTARIMFVARVIKTLIRWKS
jgi:hypothetical protein